MLDVIDEITVVEDDGLLNVYDQNGPNWDAPTGIFDTLAEQTTFTDPVNNVNGWIDYLGTPAYVLTRKNQWRRVYDDQGRLFLHADSQLETTLAIVVEWYPDDFQDDTNLRGKIFRVRDASACRRLVFNYDAQNDYRLKSIYTEFVGDRRTWLFEYAADPPGGTGWMERIKLLDVNSVTLWTIEFGYDTVGRITSIKDKEGNTSVFAYDTDNRLDTVTDPMPLGNPYTQSLDYVAYGSPPPDFGTKYTDRNGKLWTAKFNAWGGLVEVVDPLSKTVKLDYDADRNLDEFTNALSKKWDATYDGTGNLLTVADPIGHKWALAYDTYNNVTDITPPLDNLGAATRTRRSSSCTKTTTT